MYDDFYWYTHFDDPTFVYGRALAQTAGTAVMRLADAELLPFDFTNFAETVHTYLDEFQKMLREKQESVRERNMEIEEGVFSATDDPQDPLVPPKAEQVPPHLNFAPLENGVDALTRSARRYQKAFDQAQANGGAPLAHASLAGVNRLLIESGRKLTTDPGLPRRPWYRNQIYAPGFYTGYGVKTIPAVREAIEEKQWKEADEQIERVGAVLQGEAALIEEAAKELEAAIR